MSSVNFHSKVDSFTKVEFGSKPGVERPLYTPVKSTKGSSTGAGKKTSDDAAENDKLVLTNAVQGKVVTRFPPEASGFVHIGHAKAALVNRMLADKYDGKMIFRFDDTNPDKEKHHFEDAIIEDLGKLGVAWDIGVTYSSDYFKEMMVKAEWMLKEGLAYCDDTDRDLMKQCRFDGKATASRTNSKETNWSMWEEMKAGSAKGQTCCLRAMMSIDNPNKCMRDPVMYRCNVETPHTRTGDAWKVYPTYDFCCPIVDSIEGVTHALRTNEYHDRNAQYDWFCQTLKIRNPQLEDFSRLNMEYTCMSKRKLTKFVEEGKVDGWDDPRFPTVRALLRRGLKVESLRKFVEVQGMSKSVNFMEWSKLWVFNTQFLDPSVARYTAVSDDLKVVCKVEGQNGVEECTKPKHMKNTELGDKTYYKASTVIVDAEDVLLCADKEEITLMGWGNAFISNIEKNADGMPTAATLTLNPTGDIKKTSKKITWVAKTDKTVKLTLNEYDHLLTKKKLDPEEDLKDIIAKDTRFTQNAIGEPAFAQLKHGEIIQIERRGYYIVDKIEDGHFTLIYIPDGKEKVNHLSAKAQYLKSIGAMPVAGDAKAAKPKGTKAEENLTLEEKRALKAAKKAASAKK